MEISSKIHIEQPAPPGAHISSVQMSVMDRQTTKKNSTFLAALAAGEIQAPPDLAW